MLYASALPARERPLLFSSSSRRSRPILPKVVPVHVNCQMDSTRYAVFYQIYKKIFEHAPPSSGISFKRIFEKVAQHSADEDKVLVVALDDINYLFHEKEVDHVLYSLLRAHETCPGARMGVIGVMSELTLNYVLDPTGGLRLSGGRCCLSSLHAIRDTRHPGPPGADGLLSRRDGR